MLAVNHIPDAADGHGNQQSRRRHIRQLADAGQGRPFRLPQKGEILAPQVQEPVGVADQDIGRAADKTAQDSPENGNAAGPDHHYPQRVGGVDRPEVDDMEQPRPDNAADNAPDRHRQDGVPVHSRPAAPTDGQDDRYRYGHKGQKAVPGKQKGAEIQNVGVKGDTDCAQDAH